MRRRQARSHARATAAERGASLVSRPRRPMRRHRPSLRSRWRMWVSRAAASVSWRRAARSWCAANSMRDARSSRSHRRAACASMPATAASVAASSSSRAARSWWRSAAGSLAAGSDGARGKEGAGEGGARRAADDGRGGFGAVPIGPSVAPRFANRGCAEVVRRASGGGRAPAPRRGASIAGTGRAPRGSRAEPPSPSRGFGTRRSTLRGLK